MCGTFDGSYCMVQTLWVRLFTAFLGHGPWTAIVCATLFRERGRVASVLNRRVLLAFLLAVALHTLWDANPILLGIPVAAVSLLVLRSLMQEGQAQQAAALSALTLVKPGEELSGSGEEVECRRCGLGFPASAVYCVRCGLSLA
jgi:RsiW-degrading membrane proteinase PrsW (M82 family)